MPLPDAVRCVAACAPGKRVTVVTPDGKAYALPIVPEPASIASPDPMTIAAKQLLESDAQSRALLESVGKNFAEVFARVDDSIGAVAVGQAQVAQSVAELSGTLHLSVKPVYDKAGKLIGAQRVKKIGV